MNTVSKDFFQKCYNKYPVIFIPIMGYILFCIIFLISFYINEFEVWQSLAINIAAVLLSFSISYHIFQGLKKVIPAAMRDKNLSDFALELGIDNKRLLEIKNLLINNQFQELKALHKKPEYSLDKLLNAAKTKSIYKTAITSEKNKETSLNEEDYDLRSILTNHEFVIIAVIHLYNLIQQKKQNEDYEYIAANREGSIILAYFVALLLGKKLLLITESEKFKRVKDTKSASEASAASGDHVIDVHISGDYQKNCNKKVIIINDSISGGSNIKNAAKIIRDEGMIPTDLFLIFIKGDQEKLKYSENTELNIYACQRKKEIKKKLLFGIEDNDTRHIRLILTEDCNLNCHFCHKEGIYVEKPKRNVKNCLIRSSTPDYRMQTDIGYFKKLALKLKEHFPDIKKIVLTGGEPLLNSSCAQIAKILKDQQYSVHLTTNGVFLNKDELKNLFDSGIDCINISIYSHDPDEYAQFHGTTPDTCKTVLDNINNIENEYCSKVKVNLIFEKGDLTTSTRRDAYKGVLSKFDFFSDLSSRKNIKISFISQLDSDKPKEMKNFIDLIQGDEAMQKKWPLIGQKTLDETMKTYYKYGNPTNPATWEFDPLPITSELKSCKSCPEKSNCIEGPYAFRIRTTENGCEVFPCLIMDCNKNSLVFDQKK